MGLPGHFTIKKIVVPLHPFLKVKCLTKTAYLLKKSILLIALVAVIVFSLRVHHSFNTTAKNLISFDLDSIRKRGKIIAVTDFNSTDYFLYKGEPMGFNYELLKAFSDNLGIDLELVTENRTDKAIEMLNSGNADLLAFNLKIDSSEGVQFTVPLGETRQVLVQRKPPDWRALKSTELDKTLIRNRPGLAGKTIYVEKGSSHAEQLRLLEKEIGDSINIVEVPFDCEKLIKHVASGQIELTVCDENVAQVNAGYYSDIDVSTPVSYPQNFAWGVRKYHSEALVSELNRWLTTYKKSTSYALLYAKYFKNSRSILIVNSDFYALNTGKVSRYDALIRKFSAVINWDWRLLASLIYQESHFNPNVESYTGAFGLMQIMPETGKDFGIDITASPENNLRAGIRYIALLRSIFDPKIPDEKERINFILAAYNAGPGHVLDAMKLAEKNGMDPQKWDGNVAIWLLKKSQPKYYNDAVVKNGYFKGTESVNFVSEILDRFEHYKNIIP
jgi:peptidoglycan lytic transglycosylase F